MNAYIYQAALYCEDCGLEIISRLKREIADKAEAEVAAVALDLEKRFGIDPDSNRARPFFDSLERAWVRKHTPDMSDEGGYDSDEWPKGPYSDGGGEADVPQHCDACHEFLENPLTDDGMDYVREHRRDEWDSFYEIDREEEDEDKPEEGDLFTEDHIRFYEVGGKGSDVFSRRLGRGVVVKVEEDQDWQKAVRAYMDQQQFWPNVWFVSDHGNVSLLSLEETNA